MRACVRTRVGVRSCVCFVISDHPPIHPCDHQIHFAKDKTHGLICRAGRQEERDGAQPGGAGRARGAVGVAITRGRLRAAALGPDVAEDVVAVLVAVQATGLRVPPVQLVRWGQSPARPNHTCVNEGSI